MDFPLGSFVSARRKSLSLSQGDLADRLHYTNQAISNFEKGDTSPSIAILPSLANVLELSLDDLLAQEENPAAFLKENPPFNQGIVSANLAALRRNHHYSQNDESAYLGVSRRTIIHYEQGKSIPSLDVLSHILSVYQIKPSVFFYERIPLEEPAKTSIGKMISLFVMGFLLGGGILSAILVPSLSKNPDSSASSSTPYQYGSGSGTSTSTSSSESSSSDPINGLNKLVIITTAGQARNASVYVGQSLTLTLYAEPSFDFTTTTSSAYSLAWSIDGWGDDVSGISLSAASPYPCETISVSYAKPGIGFRVYCRLTYLKDTSRYFDAEIIDVTVYQ
jgi:transcriptional regulator with XRE-family HTH domain